MILTKNFNSIEFDCKDGTPVPLKYLFNVRQLAEQLQKVRDYLNEPMHINSGFRTVEHNKKIGGVKYSQHLKAKAADITVKSKTPKQMFKIFEIMIDKKIIMQGGLFLYPGFVHYDIRGTKAR